MKKVIALLIIFALLLSPLVVFAASTTATIKAVNQVVQPGDEQRVEFVVSAQNLKNANIFQIVITYDSKVAKINRSFTKPSKALQDKGYMQLSESNESGRYKMIFGITPGTLSSSEEELITFTFNRIKDEKGTNIKVNLESLTLGTIDENDKTAEINCSIKTKSATTKIGGSPTPSPTNTSTSSPTNTSTNSPTNTATSSPTSTNTATNTTDPLNTSTNIPHPTTTVIISDPEVREAVTYYQVTSEDELWDKAKKYDINNDNVIDVADFILLEV